ncbi:MAG: ATP-binding protein [Flavobacteriaceae bacterium]
MNLSARERATIDFYQWEYLGRGYYHFEVPVDIEPPYIPFSYKKHLRDAFVDDGKVPSLLNRISKWIAPIDSDVQEQEEIEVLPTYLKPENTPQLEGLSLCFSKGQEINPAVCVELLNLLSFTNNPISFEILASEKEIRIQIVCGQEDSARVKSQLAAFFPSIVLQNIDPLILGFNDLKTIAICDFGISNEYMLPIYHTNSFSIDPLTSIIASMEHLTNDDTALFQIIFKGVTAPWARDIPLSVSDGMGGSFFIDTPQMLPCAKEKVASPLFSVVIRIATQGNNDQRSKYLNQELTRSITSLSSSQYNSLIPLSNEGYKYDFHVHNVYHRLSNRLGCILNAKELSTFVHYPNKTVVSSKLGFQTGKTKRLPKPVVHNKYTLGINHHNSVETKVTLSDEMRLRHTHIVGATGVGKSTLIANMMIEDMKGGNGCALFDPHGDIVEDVLLRIPNHRKQDVIIIDPSDENYSIGFNLLGATTDAEKIVLSSDLVSSFKRHATAWGDNMTAVLSNAINTFLESSRNGTLIELKRFLLEESFRKEFLKSVDDPSIHYYWNNEYVLVRKGIAPLLTRIDTFLRPKVIRYILAQTGGVDFKECIKKKKIVLIKLSQGLIGEENSFLLGSIFLSKFNQVGQSRQSLQKSERHPYYIYLDEFQNFITPSITRILSGARKYGLGLILAHQELSQIDDVKTLNSVISNPYIRICFRLGDNDAKKLESGFSYFEQSDLQSLGTGETIVRVGSSNNDFNMETFPLPEIESSAMVNRTFIIENTRNSYARSREKLDELLIELLPKQTHFKKEVTERIAKPQSEPTISKEEPVKKPEVLKNTSSEIGPKKDTSFEIQKEEYLESQKEKERSRKHYDLQSYVKTIASQRGFKAIVEHPIEKDDRIDVALHRDKLKIAVEISVTNTIDYEVQNIQKCIDVKYDFVLMLCDNETHLYNIKTKALQVIPKKQQSTVYFVSSKIFAETLDSIIPKEKIVEKRIKGYRVKTNYSSKPSENNSQKSIGKIIMQSLRKKK